MKQTINLAICISFITLTGCKKQIAEPKEVGTQVEDTSKNDTFYQYNIWWAFVNKVFDADLKVADLKNNGDTGLGSFNLLDGEMVMLDGIAYRIKEDGEVVVGKETDKIIYANAAYFENDINLELSGEMNLELLKTRVLEKLPSPNFFYVIKIDGTFTMMKCGGLHKQRRPFEQGLDVLIPNRPVFEGTDVEGTMVGFYCPDFIGNINAKGFHFHFISADRKFGGHVMEFTSTENLKVGIDKKAQYHFQLPDNEDFSNVGFEKEFQYQKKSAE